jgi:outer membrane receptor protein involved in Fe transport
MLAAAQTETGRITGTVTDSQGAVVPGATVTATNVGTQIARTGLSDAQGRYTIANVPPAVYDVSFQLTGFKTVTKRVQVNVGAEVGVDGSLEVGALSEIVAITAALPVINTQNSEISTTVTQQQINELPTITRDPFDLVAVAGGVTDTQDKELAGAEASRGANGFTINGLRASSTNVLLDGVANNDEFFASVGQPVPMDAVQEFSVITSNFSAQYGRATGGIVNVVTKSGANTFNGSAYEYFRNDKLATRTVDQKARDIPKSPFSRHQPGFSVGGPIIRNKAQFFVSSELIRVRSDATDISLVPTPEFLAAMAPGSQAFFNKFPLVQPINGPVIRRSEIGGTPGGPFEALPASMPIFGQVQRVLPVDAGAGDPQDTQELVARVDWSLGPNTNSYVRYALFHRTLPVGAFQNSPYAGFDSLSKDNNHNVLGSITRVWSSSLISQSKVAFNRIFNDQPLGEQPPVPSLYIRQNSAQTINNLRVALPGYFPFNPSSGLPADGAQNLLQFYHDQTWLKGGHDVRVGGSFVRINDNRTFAAYLNPVEVLGAGLPDALDNLMIGQLLLFQAAVDPQGKYPGEILTLPVKPANSLRNFRYNEWAVYANDSWSLGSNVTANLGMRYEYYGVQHNTNAALDSNFYYGPGATVPEQIRTGSVQLTSDSPVGGFWRPDRNNFAPRLGLAWDVFGDGRMSVRGGYGMAYERNFGNVTFNVIQNPPNYAVIAIVNGTDVPAGTLPITADNAGPLSGTGQKALPQTSVRHVEENIKNAYAHFWSAALQRTLPMRTIGSIEYTGSKGLDLYAINQQNIPGTGAFYLGDANPTARENPQYSALNTRTNGGNSLYHGVTFGLENRGLGDTGLSFTAKYTLSHAKDNLSTTFSETYNQFNLGLLDPYNPNIDYGDADYDVRHRVAFSGIWEIPFARNRTGWAKAALSGWQAAVLVGAQSGAPFTIWDCSNGGATGRCIRLQRVGDLTTKGSSSPRSTGDPNTYEYLDLSNQLPGAGSYINPITGTSAFGPFPSNMTERNIFRMPGRWNADAVFSKRFRFNGTQALQLRLEMYNLFAHANQYVSLGSADISGGPILTSFFGDTGARDGAAAGDGQRRLQIGLRFDF